MNRTLAIERLYWLGDFKNVKFGDTITDIPEELALDIEFTSRVTVLQLIQIEQAYYKYVDIGRRQNREKFTQEEVNAFLEDQRVTLFSELKDVINGKVPDEDENEVLENEDTEENEDD